MDWRARQGHERRRQLHQSAAQDSCCHIQQQRDLHQGQEGDWWKESRQN